MKRALLFLLVACLSLSSISSAVVLLNDTWADSSRAETNLPTESAVWVGTPGNLTVAPGSLAYTQSSGSQKLWTHFAPDGSPVSLSVGHQLVATIEFTPTGLYDNSSKSFRFCLVNDPTDPQVQIDTNDGGGGSGDPWADSQGYAVFLPLSTGASKSSNSSVGKHTTLTGSSLMDSTGDWTLSSGGDHTIVTDGAMLTMTLVLDYVAANQMDVIFSIFDAGGLISTNTFTDDGTVGGLPIATEFDHLFFRFSKASETADVIDFHSFTVEHVVPEPATMALLGLGGLLAIRKKR